MEEILASIRRIIADDQPLAGAPAPVPPAPVSPTDASPAALPSPEQPSAELPMASESAQPAVEPEPTLAELPPEHGTVAAPQFASPEGTAGFAETPHPLAPQPPEAPVANAPEAEPKPVHAAATELSVSEPDPHEAALRAMHDDTDLRAAIHALHEDTLYEAVAEEAPMRDQAMRDQPLREPPIPPLDKPEPPASAGLFSAATSQSLASAFNTLAISRLTADSQELRGLAQEMLRPLLKDWLNENLPGLVETIIREEIEQMARRPR